MIPNPRRALAVRATAPRLATLLSALTLFVAGCSDRSPDAAAKKPTPLVKVAPATTERLVRTIERTGDVVPVTAVTIAATVEGPIASCPWREGDTVEAGEVLVTVDRPLYRAELEASEAALAVARARLADLRAGSRPEERAQAREAVREAEEAAAFARIDRDRTARLVERGALSGETLDGARVALTAAEARLEAARQELAVVEQGATSTELGVQRALVAEAEAGLTLARARLEESVIRAPFAGTVTRVHVRPGDLVSPHVPLVELADLTELVVRFDVPEAEATAVKVGQAVTVLLDALPDRPLHAEVVRIYPTLEPGVRTRTVEAGIVEPVPVVSGMFARVTVPVATAEDAVTVPFEALRETADGGSVVFAVAAGKANRREVVIGLEAGGRVEVHQGLRAGENVVVAGHEKLKDGAAVRVAPPAGSEPSGTKPDGPPSTPGAAGDGAPTGGRP